MRRPGNGCDGAQSRGSAPPGANGVGVNSVATLSRPKLLDEIFQALVEGKLEAPTFVVDYPKELSPLAKPSGEIRR